MVFKVVNSRIEVLFVRKWEIVLKSHSVDGIQQTGSQCLFCVQRVAISTVAEQKEKSHAAQRVGMNDAIGGVRFFAPFEMTLFMPLAAHYTKKVKSVGS